MGKDMARRIVEPDKNGHLAVLHPLFVKQKNLPGQVFLHARLIGRFVLVFCIVLVIKLYSHLPVCPMVDFLPYVAVYVLDDIPAKPLFVEKLCRDGKKELLK